MDVIRKDATITNTDDAFPGSFEVILSAPTRDRDGEILTADTWKTPLPDHIAFDIDHGMTVDKTVGSGAPRVDEVTGNLIVSGTYSSLPRAQEVRTLVKEGHIRSTSVTFMREKTQKDGKTVETRELLNGTFTPVPSNREAVVLSAKDVKSGARNSATDLQRIQDIHDAAAGLGADCAPSDAPDVSKSISRKDADTEAASDPGVLAAAADAATDAAIDLFAKVDPETLPAEVQQAIALVQAADAALDELLDALGVTDPDEGTETAVTADPTAAAKAATVEPAAAPVEVTDSDVTARFLQIRLAAFQ